MPKRSLDDMNTAVEADKDSIETNPPKPKSSATSRKSPRINITISLSTYKALQEEMKRRKDLELRANMSALIDEAIREKLQLKAI